MNEGSGKGGGGDDGSGNSQCSGIYSQINNQKIPNSSLTC